MKITTVRLPEIVCAELVDSSARQQVIEASISSRDLTKNMVRCKSSNIWSYALNVRDSKHRYGDMIIQFKGKNGGPDDIYMSMYL